MQARTILELVSKMGSCPFLNRSKLRPREEGRGFRVAPAASASASASDRAILGAARSGFKNVFLKSLLVISLLGAFAALFVCRASRAEDASAAIGMIRSTIEDLVRIDQNLSGPANTAQRRAKLRELIAPKFDFEEMAKRSLGSQWPSRTPQEQAEFVKVFSDLLAHTYISRIEDVKPGMVKVDSERLEFPRSQVKTTVTSSGSTFPIEYKLLNVNGNWRVYDVVIENIGLVANYRNEFAGIVRKEGFEGLMARLREKSQKLQG